MKPDILKPTITLLMIILWQFILYSQYETVPIAEVKAHEGPITSIAVSEHQSILATGGQDGKIKLWKLGANDFILLKGCEIDKLEDEISGLIFTSDSKTLIAASRDGMMVLWDIERCMVSDFFSTGEYRTLDSPITGLALSVDERNLALSCSNGQVIILQYNKNENSIKFSQTFNNNESKTFDFEVSEIKFIANSNYLLTASNDRNLRIWDFKSNRLVAKKEVRDYVKGLDIHITEDNHLSIAIGLDIKGPEIWMVPLNSPQSTNWNNKTYFQKQQFDILDIIFSTDKNHVFTSSTDGTISINNWGTGKNICNLYIDNDYYTVLTLNPTHKRLISGTNQGYLMWWREEDLLPVVKLPVSAPLADRGNPPSKPIQNNAEPSKTSFRDRNGMDVAVFFAMNKYKDPNYSELKNPIKDAENIARILREKYQFETEVIPDPTYDVINQTIDKYADKYKKNTFNKEGQLLIFFSGHGDTLKKEAFIMASNSIKDTYSSRINYSALRARIDDIDCNHIFVIIDACYSGAFGKKDILKSSNITKDSMKFGRNFPYSKAEIDYTRNLGVKCRKYLSSGAVEQTSDDSQLAFHLQDGLIKAYDNRNNHPELTSDQLFSNYLFPNVMPKPEHNNFGKNIDAGGYFIFFPKQ